MKKTIFVTGTDTNVGKTYSTLVLGWLLKARGFKVGVFKPVQCAGDDAAFLKEHLNIEDPLELVNPFYAKEPLSPNLAFKRSKQNISISKILKVYSELQKKYDIVLIEGAGGLMVPLKDNYLVLDLIKDIGADTVVVSRLGLGTINHTMLTVEQARSNGINVCGVLFSEVALEKRGIPEETNPDIIKKCLNIDVMGTIPYLKELDEQKVVKKLILNISLKSLLKVNKSSKAQQLIEWDKEYVWHPFTQMKDWLDEEPLVIERAEGSYLIDTNGRKYLDGVSSLWVTVHGHKNKMINAAVKNQIEKLDHSTMLGLANTPAIELAKKLVEITPKGLDKVFYSDSGSTSVEIALKMAYQYWQNIGQIKKTKIVHLENSYHGDTLGSVSVGGIDLFHKVYKKLIFKALKIKDVDQLEALFKAESQNIAAFIIEPLVQGAAGMIVWPKGALKRIQELCRKYDVIFIIDEVATGFGRTGKMFASDHENVVADIMCLAKGITGGVLPLAATLTSRRIYEGFLHDYKDLKAFFHGHTYTGNPVACSAALANIEIFEKQRVLEKLQPKIKYLSQGLEVFYNLRSVGAIRQCGFMVGIELVKDKVTKEAYPWEMKMGAKVCQKARQRGVILRPLGNVVVIMPPLSMTKKELKQVLDVTYWAIASET